MREAITQIACYLLVFSGKILIIMASKAKITIETTMYPEQKELIMTWKTVVDEIILSEGKRCLVGSQCENLTFEELQKEVNENAYSVLKQCGNVFGS